MHGQIRMRINIGHTRAHTRTAHTANSAIFTVAGQKILAYKLSPLMVQVIKPLTATLKTTRARKAATTNTKPTIGEATTVTVCQ